METNPEPFTCQVGTLRRATTSPLTTHQTFNSYTENKELKHLFVIINNYLLLIIKKSLYKQTPSLRFI